MTCEVKDIGCPPDGLAPPRHGKLEIESPQLNWRDAFREMDI